MAWFNTNPVNSKDPSKKLYLYWYDKKKKRTAKRVTRFYNTREGRQLCKKFVQQFESKLSKSSFYDEIYSRIYPVKLSEAFLKFKDSRSIEASSLSVYQNAIDRFIEACGDLPVNEYKKTDFIKLVKYLKDKNLSHNSISTYSKHLLVIWNWFKKNSFVNEIIIESIKQKLPPPRPIPENDLKKIFAYFKKQKEYPHHYQAIKLLYLTGLRISSLVNLTGSDIDFKNKVIFYQNKKAKRRSVFPIHTELEKLLKQIKAKPDQKIIPLGSRYSFNFYKRGMKQLKMKYNLHQLRKTLATTLVNNSLSIYDIKTALDHSDIETTQKYYALASMDRIRNEINKNVKFVK